MVVVKVGVHLPQLQARQAGDVNSLHMGMDRSHKFISCQYVSE